MKYTENKLILTQDERLELAMFLILFLQDAKELYELRRKEYEEYKSDALKSVTTKQRFNNIVNEIATFAQALDSLVINTDGDMSFDINDITLLREAFEGTFHGRSSVPVYIKLLSTLADSAIAGK